MATPVPVQLKSGKIRWRVQFRLTTNGKPTSERFDDVDQAWAFIKMGERYGWDMAVRARDAADTRSQSSMSLTTLFEKYLPTIRNITEGTRDGYKRMADQSWLPRLGALPIAAIRPKDVESWIDDELSRPLTKGPNKGGQRSRKTVANRHAVLSQTLEWAVTQGWIPSNPAKGIEIPERTVKRGAVYLEPETFQTILEKVRPGFRLFVRFMYQTGLRWSEATALDKTDLFLTGENPYVRVTKAWKEGPGGSRVLGLPKSKAGTRDVPISEELALELSMVAGDGLVFTAVRGGRLRHSWFLREVWWPATEHLTPRPRIHDLRHSYGSNLAANGVPLHVVQKLMGHENISTTASVYLHVSQGANRQAAQVAQDSVETRQADVLEQIDVLERIKALLL